MSAHISLQRRVEDYLAERRRLGFVLRSSDTFLAGFASYVTKRHHRGALTVKLMTDWIRQGKDGQGSPGTWVRRLGKLRLFVRYLKQFEPDTEVPDESIFGPEPGRVAPHIYHDDEIVGLLAAARQLGPHGSLRPMTFETLFGLMASTGLCVSEALHLRNEDVDLKHGMLIIRQTKFAKSRQLPIHPTAVAALMKYRRQRARHVATIAEMPFLISSRGRRLGEPLSGRQVHRVFNMLRDSLGWVNRGAHAAPRLHDLRHYPESRNMPSQIVGARTGGAFRSIVEGWLSAYSMRSECIKKCEKLVFRSKAADSSRLWIHLIQRGLLHLEIGIEIYLRRLDRFVPKPKGDHATFYPCLQKFHRHGVPTMSCTT